MTLTINSKIGEWVAENIAYAKVLDRNKIDFCCGGDLTLAESCKNSGIDYKKLLEELKNVSPESNSINPSDLTLADLTDYIQKEFHEEIQTQIPIIQTYLNKVVSAHGKNHPELFQIKELLDEGFEELIRHLEKEEQILFPLVKELDSDNFILSPIAVMECEHDIEGERYKKIAVLSNNYTVPYDACDSYKYLYELLRNFEQRLHLHIHTENNILFPKIKNIFQN